MDERTTARPARPTTRDRPDPRIRRAAIALLLVVAAGALALSFTGLTLLGALAGFGVLAPVFAVVVDAGTGAASLYWLTAAPGTRRARYARRLALALLAVSLVGNATAHALAAGGPPVPGLAGALVVALPWWAAGLVGAIPPGTLAACVHLLAMQDGPTTGDPDGRDVVGADGGRAGPGEGSGRTPGEPPGDLVVRAASLVDAGRAAGDPVGRTRLARELGISEHAARGLLDQVAARDGDQAGDGR
ncbi:DUF2637 domain-containing protein [Pseudonocardia endophytica]|uniref:DUF2637 domain-containing protein n=1 Tax=Pseudonocardia endophytica TaxID=401976 RepID=A0A4R1HS12_PSEEN|nr:DUF2637 domain-containing protein [Pseudonocardia endophytica]TCK25424.1 hypothetical protein EV378_1232 [Pseudonocardia endophytica]